MNLNIQNVCTCANPYKDTQNILQDDLSRIQNEIQLTSTSEGRQTYK